MPAARRILARAMPVRGRIMFSAAEARIIVTGPARRLLMRVAIRILQRGVPDPAVAVLHPGFTPSPCHMEAVRRYPHPVVCCPDCGALYPGYDSETKAAV